MYFSRICYVILWRTGVMDCLESYGTRLGEEGSINYTNNQEKVMGPTLMTVRNRDTLVYAEKLQG